MLVPLPPAHIHWADRRRASPLVRPWQHGLRPLALRAGACSQARRLAQRRSLQRLGAPGRDGARAAQARRRRRRQSGRWSTSSPRCSPTGCRRSRPPAPRPFANGVHSAEVVLNILARQRDPGPSATILTPAALTLRHAPMADCTRYDNLRRTFLTPFPDRESSKFTFTLARARVETVRKRRKLLRGQTVKLGSLPARFSRTADARSRVPGCVPRLHA